MSKPLTSRQEQLASKRSRRGIPLVVITTYTDRGLGTVDEVLYYSDRTFYYDYGNTGNEREFRGVLAGIDDFSAEMAHLATAPASAAMLFRDLQFQLYNRPVDGTPLYETIRLLNLEGATVEVGELLLYDHESDHVSALTGAEHVVFFRGEIARVFDVSLTITVACQSLRPQIAGALVLDDPTINDPRDIGKSVPHVYGEAKRVPALGYRVGWVTTLVNPITSLGSISASVTDATGFPQTGTFDVIINGEECVAEIQVSPDRMQFTSRGSNGTIASVHAAGETVVELITTSEFIIANHESSAVQAVYVTNPYSGEIVRIAGGTFDDLPTSIFDTNDTTMVSGFTLTTVTLTRAQLDTLMQSLAAQAAVTQQPVVGHEVTETIVGESPTSGQANVRDGDLGTLFTLSTGGTTLIDMTFTGPSGAIQSQHVGAFISGLTGTGGLWTAEFRIGGVLLGSADETEPDGWYMFHTTSTSNVFRVAITGPILETGSCDVHEVRRDVNYLAADPALDTDAAIEGASVGFGLELWADVDGVEAPNGDYTVASGLLLEHPADIARHMIEARAGEDIDEPNWDEQGSGKHAFVDMEIGNTLEGMLGALAFESRSQIITAELAAGTLYRRLSADNPSASNYDYDLPAGAPVFDDYGDAVEDGRDLTTVFTRWRAHYDLDRFVAAKAGGIDPFRGIERADPDVMDLAGLATTDADDWEKLFGRKDHEGFAFQTIQADTATVDQVLAFYVTESVRVAASLRIRGVPWVLAYATELGDIAEANVDWWSVARKVRVLGVTKRWGDGFVDLIVAEVL